MNQSGYGNFGGGATGTYGAGGGMYGAGGPGTQTYGLNTDRRGQAGYGSRTPSDAGSVGSRRSMGGYSAAGGYHGAGGYGGGGAGGGQQRPQTAPAPGAYGRRKDKATANIGSITSTGPIITMARVMQIMSQMATLRKVKINSQRRNIRDCVSFERDSIFVC